tara:strand:+ start:3921 stop:4157 length:237 start_codon:yes stop_codon:yes gene_type:complete
LIAQKSSIPTRTKIPVTASELAMPAQNPGPTPGFSPWIARRAARIVRLSTRGFLELNLVFRFIASTFQQDLQPHTRLR